MGPLPENATLHDLVPLMYRADWAAVSLSATVTSWTDHALRIRVRDRGRRHAAPDPDSDQELPVTENTYQVLLAPGGKYRISHFRDGQVVHEGCDGVTGWLISPGSPGTPGRPGLAQVFRHHAAPWSGLDDLQYPARLLSRFSLELTGTAAAGDRPVCRLTGRARPLSGYGREAQDGSSAAEVRLLVDAGTGLLLSYEELADGQPVHRTVVSDLRLDPAEAADGARFQPPPGIDAPPRPPSGPQAAMPGLTGDVVRGAAGAAAAAMGFAIRHWPGSAAAPDGTTAGSPAAGGPDAGSPASGTATGGPAPGTAAGGPAPGNGRTGPRAGPLDPEHLDPVSDGMINLLHRTGRPAPQFTAEVDEWDSGRLATVAVSRMRGALPAALDGVLGPDAVWDAIETRDNSTARVSRLRLAGPGRYRIDRLAGGKPSSPGTVGCDGDRSWQVYGSRVGARPAQPLSREFACLADPAWLLGAHRLWAGGEITVGGRRGFLVAGRPAGDRPQSDPEYFWPGSPADQVEAVVDAELAVILRLTGFLAGEPVICYELSNLSTVVPDTGAFDVPPGARTGPLASHGITAAGAVKAAAGLGVVGASSLVGWLQKRPRSRAGDAGKNLHHPT
jgi:hypothetical protein